MIPVLGIPILSRPDLLAACIASIDEPIARLVVIDNSPDASMGEVAEAALPDCVETLIVATPPANLGYTASVNHVIRTHPKAPWWAIANADTVFAPGDLGRLADATVGLRWVGVVDWRVFGLTAETVERVGFWDECFFNYCSDADYEWRCHLGGVEILRLPGATTHVGSVSYAGDQRYAQHNARSYPLERAYYRDKWGGDLRGGEAFTTPFDAGGHLGSWRLELPRLAAETWD